MIEAIIGRFKTEQDAQERLLAVSLEDAGLAVEHRIRYDDEDGVWLLSRKALDVADEDHLRLRELRLYTQTVSQLYSAGAWGRAEASLEAIKRLADIISKDIRRRREEVEES